MATNITKSVFPEFGGLLSTPREALMAAPIEAARTGGQTIDQALVGAISGAGEQFKQSVGGLFGQKPAAVAQQDRLAAIVQQVQAQGIDLATPEGQVALAQALSQFPEFLGMATAMRQQAATQAQEAQLKQAQTTKAYAEAQKALTERVPAALEQADRLRLQKLQTQFGMEEGARRFREERDEAGRRQAAAGVPASGEVKVGDLATAQKIVTDLVGGPKDKLNTVKTAKTFLDQAKQGEGAALPQLQRQLVKLVGDSQIGQGEVRDALGSSGIVGDTISAVNKFMTGVPTQDKLNSVEQVINALERINAQSYNQGRTRAEQLIGEARFSDTTKKTLIPPAYRLPGEKPQAGAFVEGKIYKDANGNRARYVNGNWVPVQ